MTVPSPLYILSAAQISLQAPLTEDWTEWPRRVAGAYVRAWDPRFKALLRPAEARRMSLILKRAAAVSDRALHAAGLACPDAVVTGTGWGCVESTEQFLQALCLQGERLLSPTHFMQSTHNTIGSLMAIRTRCHGYNVTFSHRATSFDCALHDAALLLRGGRATSALVGGHDEVTPDYYTLLRRMGYVGHPGQCPCSETSVALVLSATTRGGALCRLSAWRQRHRPTPDEWAATVGEMLEQQGLTPDRVDLLVTGHNGFAPNDRPYDRLAATLFPRTPQFRYKWLFGENYSASAAAVYAAAHLLHRGCLPRALGGNACGAAPLHSVLVLNHAESSDFSCFLLQPAAADSPGPSR